MHRQLYFFRVHAGLVHFPRVTCECTRGSVHSSFQQFRRNSFRFARLLLSRICGTPRLRSRSLARLRHTAIDRRSLLRFAITTILALSRCTACGLCCICASIEDSLFSATPAIKNVIAQVALSISIASLSMHLEDCGKKCLLFKRK